MGASLLALAKSIYYWLKEEQNIKYDNRCHVQKSVNITFGSVVKNKELIEK